MASIFDNQQNKPTNKWWKKDVVGAKIEGTLVSKRTAHDTLSGKIKNVYELKLPNGEYWNVQGGAIDAKPKAGIDIQMEHVRLGQIVGFEYTGDKPPKQPGHHPAKLVQVWQNPKLVDEAWLKENAESTPEEVSDEAETVPQEPFPSTPVKAAEPRSVDQVLREDFGAKIPETKPFDLVESLREINNLAVARLGADTPEKVKLEVTLATGLALTEANIPTILEKMRALPATKK